MRRQTLVILAIVFTALVVMAPFAFSEPDSRLEPASTSEPETPKDFSELPTFADVVRYDAAIREANIYAWNAAVWANAVRANQAAAAAQAAAARPAAPRSSGRATSAATIQTPAAAPSGDVVDIIRSVFGANANRAIQIAQCESGLNPYARNRSGAAGLFQLLGHADLYANHGWNASTDWSDPFKNATVAFDLSHGGTSWGAWVCR